jgi:cysteine-rich repeat protein
VVSGDGCSATCQLEVISEIEPNDTPAQATANGAFSTSGLWSGSINPASNDDYFMITLAQTVDLKIETFDGNGPVTCSGIDTLLAFFAPNGTSQLASDDDDGPGTCSLLDPAVATDAGMRHLLPGNYFVRVKAFSSVIPAYTVRLTFTAICGNGVKEGFEECDGPAGPACDVNCNIIPVCGDGIVKAPETCDDMNLNGGDGCSASCTVEPNYICVGAPSVCTLHENVCNDGMDNDGDNLVDCFDPDCQGQAICVILPCDVGQTQRIYNSTDTPKAIQDLVTITSTINVPDVAIVNRAIVKLNITHTWDSDLDIFLASPAATNVELSTDNGSLNDNYTNTIFDQNCLNSIVSGTAPFTGCFKPEGNLATVIGQGSAGNWVLSVGDDASGDTGTLNSWNLILCTTP